MIRGGGGPALATDTDSCRWQTRGCPLVANPTGWGPPRHPRTAARAEPVERRAGRSRRRDSRGPDSRRPPPCMEPAHTKCRRVEKRRDFAHWEGRPTGVCTVPENRGGTLRTGRDVQQGVCTVPAAIGVQSPVGTGSPVYKAGLCALEGSYGRGFARCLEQGRGPFALEGSFGRARTAPCGPSPRLRALCRGRRAARRAEDSEIVTTQTARADRQLGFYRFLCAVW